MNEEKKKKANCIFEMIEMVERKRERVHVCPINVLRFRMWVHCVCVCVCIKGSRSHLAASD